MSYSIIPTHRFEKELKRLAKKFPSLKGEFANLIALIMDDPDTVFILETIAIKYVWR